MNKSKNIVRIFPSSTGNIYMFNKIEKSFSAVHPLFIAFNKKKKFAKCLKEKEYLDFKKDLAKKNICFSLSKIKKMHKQYLFIKSTDLNDEKDNNTKYSLLSDSSLIVNNFNSTQQLVFEVTDKCNLNCTYCSYGPLYTNYDERYKKDLDFKTIKAVLDYYAPFWEKRAKANYKEKINISFYGGEPLMKLKLIKKTIYYLKEKNYPEDFFTFSLTTNALLLKESIHFLVKFDFALLISLDGNNYNHSYRVDHLGKNSYERVVKNLKHVKYNYPEYFKNKINFNTVLHARNSYSEINDFFDNQDLLRPTITELSVANARDNNQIKEYQYKQEEIQEFKNLDEYIDKRNINSTSLSFFRKYCINHYQNHIDLYNFYKTKVITPTGTCLPFSLRIFVSTNRKLLSCEKIGNQFQLGDIDDNGKINIDTEKALKQFNAYVLSYMSQCRSCYKRFDCKVCAFRNGILDKNLNCPEYVSILKFMQEVQFNISIIEKKPELYFEISSILTS